MAPTNDKASDLERRVSTRTSVRISLDALDEDYDFAAAGMVADGFRPREGSSSRSLSSGSSTLAPDDSSASTTVPKFTRPSTTPKFQMVLNSSVSRDDPAALTRQATGSTESTVYQPPDGPYQGPSVPSHPYQMYPQNVRSARTMSTTTASTVTVPASEASYSGPRGPSHPYTLYPQTDVIESEAAQAAAIPLGFSSLPDQYRRRTGPDGDDVADIIGPDGHTEQLPPYTRYPDEAYARKAAAVDGSLHDVSGGATVVPPIQTAATSSTAAIPGAGGLGLATRNPEFESTDDLGTPQSRHSTRSFASDDSARGINLTDGVEEKTTPPPKKWQLWMRRKLCGVVPYWALCLAGILLLIMAIVLGTVIGVFLRQRKPPPRKDTWEPIFGAAPTSAPNNLPALPLGTYFVLLMAVPTVPNTCFTNPGLSQAWNCLVSSGLHLTVSQGDHDYIASLNSNHTYTIANNVYSYGEQPPTIPRPVHLDLVNDKSEQGHGIAWHKLMAYNKTVILPESWISSSSSSSNSQRKGRRDASASAGLANFKRKGVAQPGEKPWICNWPDTYLELYIYAQQNASSFPWPSSSSPMSASTPSSSASSSATSSTSSTPSPTGAQGYYESNPGHWMPGDGSSFTRGYWPANNPAHMPDHATADTQTTSTTTTTTTQSTSASTTGPFGRIDGGGTGFPTPPPRYPRVVKLEERRISTAGAPKAQCTQVEVQGPGQQARVLVDHDGNPVVIDIDETEAVLPSGAPTPVPDPPQRLAKKSPTDISPCGCIWYLT